MTECLAFKQWGIGKHDYYEYRDSHTLLLQLDTFIFPNLDKELQESYISPYTLPLPVITSIDQKPFSETRCHDQKEH